MRVSRGEKRKEKNVKGGGGGGGGRELTIALTCWDISVGGILLYVSRRVRIWGFGV